MGSSGSGHRQRGLYFTIDLHLHTSRGSADSNLAPLDLVARAKHIGIGAVCITEHDTMWEFTEQPELRDESKTRFLRGMEVTTDMGHIGVFGLQRTVNGQRQISRASSPSRTEKKMICALPTRLS